MEIQSTDIDGVYCVKRNLLGDDRGHFSRLFCKHELEDVLQGRSIKQINHSYSKDIGTIRGMHFQKPPHAEMKLITCLKGKVLDVVVDLRAGSPSFLKHYATELDANNLKTLIVPEGCAHGFQVLEEDSELIYFHTEFYMPEYESGLHYNDPALAINWPIAPNNISARDQGHPHIDIDFKGLNVDV